MPVVLRTPNGRIARFGHGFYALIDFDKSARDSGGIIFPADLIGFRWKNFSQAIQAYKEMGATVHQVASALEAVEWLTRQRANLAAGGLDIQHLKEPELLPGTLY